MDTQPQAIDRILFLRDIREALGISRDTLRRWRQSGKFPTPDIAPTDRTVGWRISTLSKHGIHLAAE